LAPLHALLDAREQLRRDRLVSGAPRHRFVAGRALLRQALGAWLGCEEASVRLEPGLGGKPRIVAPGGGAACHFNLAHAGGWVVAALALECEVGVDLEGLDAAADWRAIAPVVCSPREMRALQGFPEAGQRGAFLRAWTRKEAVLKAAGTGLGGVSPSAVEVLPDDPTRELELPDADGRMRRWRVEDFSPPPGYCGAVAWELR
jgi:4'-phosphopantetheinyl transferase